MNNFKPTVYKLMNVASGRIFEDTGWVLDDPESTQPSLVRAVYESSRLGVRDDSWGLYKFCNWLPVSRTLKGSSAPITYRSEALGRYLGLENLYITFSGYLPAKGAVMTSCSFKETEAYSVCGRMKPGSDRVLVVASAGNTARAFAKVCSDNGIPLLLCVPEDNIDALWFEQPLDDCIKLITARKGGDYFDAIHLSNVVLGSDRFFAEGGAKNIARRDGMSTTVLSAVTHIGRIPDYYFQAVGSGTGAIAAWEANLRFIGDGRFGDNKMKLMVSQNAPFLPIYNAWRENSRDLPAYTDNHARAHAEEIDAKVLSNRRPPYSLAGGLYDALVDTGGDVLKVGNSELHRAAALFERLEGADLHPAAAVAVSSLMDSVNNCTVDSKATVMLNITGGGEKLFKQSKKLWYLRPSIVFPLDPDPDQTAKAAEDLFR